MTLKLFPVITTLVSCLCVTVPSCMRNLLTCCFDHRRDGRTLAPGELDSGSSQWAHRQKELLSRRLYMKNFWYAAGEPTSPAHVSACRQHGMVSRMRRH